MDLDVAAGFCTTAEGKMGFAAAVALAAAQRAHELLVAGTAIGDEPYADWADPARERVRDLLRRVRLAAAGEQAKALAAYESLRRRLGRELGADPAPQTRELHLAILREQDGERDGRGDRPGLRGDRPGGRTSAAAGAGTWRLGRR